MNLYEILTQKGHSGVIDGVCSIFDAGKKIKPHEYYAKLINGKKSKHPIVESHVKIRFSSGVKALGEYTFTPDESFIHDVKGVLLLKDEQKGKIRVQLIEKSNESFHKSCNFTAVYISE